MEIFVYSRGLFPFSFSDSWTMELSKKTTRPTKTSPKTCMVPGQLIAGVETPFLSFHGSPKSEGIFSRLWIHGVWLWLNVQTSCNKKSCAIDATRQLNVQDCASCASWGRSWSGNSTFAMHILMKKVWLFSSINIFFTKKTHANFASKNPAVVKISPRKFHPKKTPLPMGQSSASPPNRWTMRPRCRRSESWSYTLELSLLGVAVREIFGCRSDQCNSYIIWTWWIEKNICIYIHIGYSIYVIYMVYSYLTDSISCIHCVLKYLLAVSIMVRLCLLGTIWKHPTDLQHHNFQRLKC